MSIFDGIKEKIAHYIDIRLRLLKLSLIERISGILSYLILTFIGLFVSMGILIFMGVALAEYFATLLESRSGGYLLTAGVFLLLFGCLLLFKRLIVQSISGIFIRVMTEVDDDDDEEKSKQGEI